MITRNWGNPLEYSKKKWYFRSSLWKVARLGAIMHFNVNRNKGFTLVELMITLAIAAILMALAVPSFNSTIKNNRISTQASELITSLNYVRSEAIKRGADVTIGRADVNWENGWIITTGITTLRNHAAFEGTNTLEGTAIAVTYRGTGRTTDTNDITFTLCDDRENSTGRLIEISLTGRASITETACNVS